MPAYNEEKSLPKLLPKLQQLQALLSTTIKLVICNDGSSDSTSELLSAYEMQYSNVIVLEHHINRGLGESIRDLFEYAAVHSHEDDVIVRLDCDDSHEPKFIESMINKLSDSYDVVVASRFEKGGGQRGVSRYKTFISQMANLFMKFWFPIRGLREYSCGFRAYRAGLIKHAVNFYGNNFIQLKGLGFTCTLEKLIKLNMLGARFAEVPFTLRYDQKLSESKMVGSVTTLGYLVLVLMYYWPFGGWRNGYRKKLKDFRSNFGGT